MPGRSSVAAVLVAAAAVIACRRGPPPPSIASVELVPGRAGSALSEVGVAPAEVETLARNALAEAGFRVEPGRPRAHRARVEVLALRAVTDARGAAWTEAAVSLEIDPVGEVAEPTEPLVEMGQGEAPVGEAPGSAWRAALEGATRDAAAQMAIAVAADEKTVPGLLADLDAADPRVRERAIVVLGERRTTEAVPALLRRLSDPEPRVVDRAVGALALLRDPRAVGPLIDLSRRRSAREQARFARLIGDIGGDEARGYLETLAVGASEPEVRRAAAEALAELTAPRPASRAAGR
jgi:HEAT repeat protein